jgi:protein-tyrosine-phosphatase
MRKILVLCKYNQARSIAAAAALRRFFPKEVVISAGILAKPSTPIPSSILQILDEWGLYERDQRSTLTTKLLSVSPQDLVLCADDEVRNVFIQQLGIDRTVYPHIYILEDFSRNGREIPIDPVSLGVAETKIQLARTIVLALRGTRKLLAENSYIGMGFLPNSRQDHLDIQNQYIRNPAVSRLMIDVGFSVPITNIWSPRLHQHSFNPRKFENFKEISLTGKVLISKFEIDKTSQLFLSLEYYEWIKNLAQIFSLQVISQPFEILPQLRRYEAILGMIHS